MSPFIADPEDYEFPACAVPGCKRLAADPPHLNGDSKPICKVHAVELARGRCARCSVAFNPTYGAHDCYTWSNLDKPGNEPLVGRALCIECWCSG